MKIILNNIKEPLKYFLELQNFSVDDFNNVFDDNIAVFSFNDDVIKATSRLNRYLFKRIKEAIKDYEDYSGKEIIIFMG